MASLIAILGPGKPPGEAGRDLRSVDELRAALTVKQSQNDHLTDQCQTLTRRIAELQAAAAKPEQPKIIASLQKMIVGMARKHYRYEPGAAKNTAVGRIVADVALIGHSITDDTVLKHLRDAFEKFPPER